MPPIDYGSRLRAGVLVPSGNSVAEPEIRAMLPPEVSMLVTRLALRGSSKPELMRMLDRLEAASELLADAERSKLEITPVTGERIQELVAELYKTPPELTKRLAEMLR